jgi:septum formation protein
MLNDLLKPYDLVLASGSPRRKQLLEEMGISFRIETRPVNEIIPKDKTPEEIAVYLSRLKAAAFEKSYFSSNRIIITADTIVALDKQILGKPSGHKEAIKMLQQLSGKSHEVITGVTIQSSSKETSFFVSTRVYFKSLSPDEIEFYIDEFKPFDKAGAYGIQEWIGHAAIEKIEGSYFNVVGLPTHRLYEELVLFITPNIPS